MVKLTKIYTRSGDDGRTSLGNGTRVSKTDFRIEAIGTVDEVNSSIGIALLYVDDDSVVSLLKKIQNNLFDLGADLCVPDLDHDLDYKPLRVTQQQIDFLESQIDHYNKDLSTLMSFVLPGGTKASSYLHLCRTIARRAERLIVALKNESSSDLEKPLIYMNRLSDLLFVLSRYLNNLGQLDVLWVPGE